MTEQQAAAAVAGITAYLVAVGVEAKRAATSARAKVAAASASALFRRYLPSGERDILDAAEAGTVDAVVAARIADHTARNRAVAADEAGGFRLPGGGRTEED